MAESQLYEWRKKYGQVVEGMLNHQGESVEEELRRLRHENAQLTKERDLLKKTFAYFVKDVK